MNNRQAGRRRGRGGGQRSPGNPNSNSRIDNRQRGNASQLYEKYKNLARDAQMAGDRVNTEYYLQFADHYFRVLNENKSRFEDQRRQREEAGYEDGEGEDEGGDRRPYAEHRARDDAREEAPRFNGRGNGRQTEDDAEGSDMTAPRREPRARQARGGEDAPTPTPAPIEGERAVEGEPAAPQPRRRGRPRKDAAPAVEPTSLDADRLPPSLGASAGANDDENEEKPRRRRGRPRASEAAGTAG
jgi:hypothetical protein